MFLSSRLSVRLPAMTIGLALLSAATMGGISWYSARASLLKGAGERLHLAASARRDSLELSALKGHEPFATSVRNSSISTWLGYGPGSA